jgi:hypothetical protein
MTREHTLRTELIELTAKAATISDHMVRAAQSHDAHTIQDLTWELADVEHKIDQNSFELALIGETLK